MERGGREEGRAPSSNLESQRMRALDLAKKGAAKLHVFLPSGREIWTVVGKEGDQLVSDEEPYCSCKDFYYRFLSSKRESCYHLLALKLAKEMGTYDKILFHDSDYFSMVKAILHDISPLTQ